MTPTYENDYYKTFAAPITFDLPDDIEGESYLIDAVVFDKQDNCWYNHMELWSNSRKLITMYVATLADRGWIFQTIEPEESAYTHYEAIHGSKLPEPTYFCIFVPPHEQIKEFGEGYFRYINRVH